MVLQGSHPAAEPGDVGKDAAGGDGFCQVLPESTASAVGNQHSRKPALSLVQNFQASSVGRRVALI